MNIKSFRARTLAEALRVVQRELGPEATLLETREVWDGWWRGLFGGRRVEVTAANGLTVRSPFSQGVSDRTATRSLPAAPAPTKVAATRADEDLRVDGPQGSAPFDDPHLVSCRATRSPANGWEQLVQQLCDSSPGTGEMPRALFRVYTDLVEADVQEDVARHIVAQLRKTATLGELENPDLLSQRLREHITSLIRTSGPIRISPGQRNVVALVGPTGVGKTTTIAKLAANFRLRDQRRVGLITVDTYRVAAVEQLRTYADIIDLPMEVVATPREMREAIARLADVDLVLLDTAGRSPRDEVRLQELKIMLQESCPTEVHLVLSATSSPQSLLRTIQQFQEVGTTALLLTKLDESAGLGNLLPVLQHCRLPWSYLTNGQNVPDDILTAQPQKLVEWILGGSVR